MLNTNTNHLDRGVRRFQAQVLADCGRQLIDVGFRILLEKALTTEDYVSLARLQRNIKDASAVLHAIEHNAHGQTPAETIEPERRQ